MKTRRRRPPGALIGSARDARDASQTPSRGGAPSSQRPKEFAGGGWPPTTPKPDYGAAKDLHSAGVVGTYDAAIITKDADGKVKVHKHEKLTQHGAWTGAAVGAVVGILFPPALLLDVAIGGLAGGAIGHF